MLHKCLGLSAEQSIPWEAEKVDIQRPMLNTEPYKFML